MKRAGGDIRRQIQEKRVMLLVGRARVVVEGEALEARVNHAGSSNARNTHCASDARAVVSEHKKMITMSEPSAIKTKMIHSGTYFASNAAHPPQSVKSAVRSMQ